MFYVLLLTGQVYMNTYTVSHLVTPDGERGYTQYI